MNMGWALNAYMLFGAWLLAIFVHGDLVSDRHPPPSFVQTTTQGGFGVGESGLVVPPCVPGDDGYFGGTFGPPVALQYTFDMESTTGADFEIALDEITQQVNEAVIVSSFPQLCQSNTNGRLLQSASPAGAATINGFYFEQGQIIFKDQCEIKLTNEANYCNVFTAKISVFGKNLMNDDAAAVQRVAQLVVQTLMSIGSTLPANGIVQVVPSKSKVGILSANGKLDGTSASASGNSTGSERLSAGAKLGVAVAGLILAIALTLLAMYVRMDLKERSESLEHPSDGLQKVSNQESRNMLRYVGRQGGQSSGTYREDNSMLSTNEEDTIYLREDISKGSGYDGRQVILHFDPDCDYGSDLSYCSYSEDLLAHRQIS